MKLALDKGNRRLLKFQIGGAVPAPAGAEQGIPPEGVPQEGGPAQGGQDPIAMLMDAATQAIQGRDCNIAMQVCEILVQSLSGEGGGPAGPEPVVQKRGGKLTVQCKDKGKKA